jgi:hypothetical protein
MGKGGNVNSFRQADEALQGRNSARRKLGNNTYLERRGDGSIAVKLHDTDVVTYRADGSIVLDSGGWLTVTTKDRMNEHGPQGWRVYSVRGVWFVGQEGSNSVGLVYKDGITFHAEPGRVTGAGEPIDADRVKAMRDALDLLNENTVGGYWAFGENGEGLMLYDDEETETDAE